LNYFTLESISAISEVKRVKMAREKQTPKLSLNFNIVKFYWYFVVTCSLLIQKKNIKSCSVDSQVNIMATLSLFEGSFKEANIIRAS